MRIPADYNGNRWVFLKSKTGVKNTMYNDKRSYPRISVSVPAILHESRHNHEINCKVKNISEYGVAFEIPLDERFREDLGKGEPVHFQFIDTYKYGRSSETELLSANCIIRYIRVGEEFMTIGAYVAEDEFRQYALRREVMCTYDRGERATG